jgi:hypothetical protein
MWGCQTKGGAFASSVTISLPVEEECMATQNDRIAAALPHLRIAQGILTQIMLAALPGTEVGDLAMKAIGDVEEAARLLEPQERRSETAI